ncbi:rps2602, partial [Symbiodinium microadriaticum]
CVSTAKAIPKDKAIKRFIVRNLVDASALRDIRDASAFENYQLPKLYVKQYYCVEAAVHQRIVRVRSAEGRKYREAPSRMKHGEGRMRCSNCCYKTNGIPPLHHDQMNEKGQRLTGKSCHGVFY